MTDRAYEDVWKSFSTRPTENGWYAVLVCWDVREGSFPNAAYWDGEKWSRRAVCALGRAGPFATEEEAKDWAYANDPEI